ncbi:hypothetical protein BBK82_11470 [Lentzea guizhouensis]|uniref:SnoaL-like domain-containing protein n=1 Tax=Lentzea guizhouensis TaxID=1586287 RepID=A0A1B2HFT9_9PSEU|nr:nuclear transport factor 2 family protein [Lentzea guizhouensis]ANZ36593.1 hypothetical protein BBK82_11470 [Lentzea guizhouensis]
MIDQALDLLLKKDMAGFAGLWAEDGRMEFPFAPEGWPQEVSGRQAIHDYLRDYPKMIDVQDIPWRKVHVTADPDVTVAEFDLEGQVVATGKPYRYRYIVVITARDGQIVEWRDYWNPLAAGELA